MNQPTLFEAQDKRSMRRHIKGVGKIVREFLKSDVRCRNSDKYLALRVLQYKLKVPYSDSVIIREADFKRLPAFETIKRCRAHIQNVEHSFLPTLPEIRRKRGISEKVWREWSQVAF